MGILLGNNMSPLMEAYYGKSKELIACEKDLAKIIDAIHGKNNGLVDGQTIQKCKRFKDIEKRIAKVFKLKEFRLFIVDEGFIKITKSTDEDQPKDASVDVPPINIKIKSANAYTLPYSLSAIPIVGKKAADKGMMSIYTTVNKSLIYSYDLTPAELMAVILHEIGHNFDNSVFKFISTAIPWDIILEPEDEMAQVIGYLVARAMAGKIGKFIGQINSIINSAIEKVPGLPKIITMMHEYFASVYKMFNVVYGVQNVLYVDTWVHGAKKALNPSSFFGYAGEKYADSFASAHGYSVEIASVNEKFSRGSKLERDVLDKGGIGVLYDLARVSASLPYLIADPHPQEIIRVYSQLKKMKRELNDPSIPNELKPEIKKQIDDLEKLVSKMIDVYDDKNKGYMATILMNKLFIDAFKGNLDPREMLENIWRHEA